MIRPNAVFPWLGLAVSLQAQNNLPVLQSGPLAFPMPVYVGDSVSFSVSALDPDGDTLIYSWNFGDGNPPTAYAADSTSGHRFASPGRFAVTVRIRDINSGAITGSMLVAVHLPATTGRPTASTPILHDAVRDRVFCVNPDHHSISGFSGGGLNRIFEAPVGMAPQSLAQAPDGSLWVSNSGSSSVTVHDPVGGSLIMTIPLPYGSRPSGIVFSPDGSAAYLALEAGGKLVRLDPGRRVVTGEISLGPHPRALAVSHDGARILITRFISAADHGEVYEVDGRAFSTSRTWMLALDSTPDSETSGGGVPNYLGGIAIAPYGTEAIVVGKKDNTGRGGYRNGLALTFENTARSLVAHLDLVNNVEVTAKREDVDNGSLPSAVVFSPMGDLHFVAMEGVNRFQVHDPFNNGAVLERNRGTGRAPIGLAIDPVRRRLYSLSFLGRAVTAFDVSTVLGNTRYQSLPLDTMPVSDQEALPAPVLEGKRIFYDAEDTRMSRDGYISCAVCHLDGGSDGRVWDFTDRNEGLRRTTTLVGRGGMAQGPVHWSANFDEIQDFEHDMRGPFGGTGFMDTATFMSGNRNQTLGGAKAGMVPELDALAAYVASLSVVPASPWRNADGSMTSEGLRGRDLFNRSDVGCAACHSGSAFTDSRLPTPAEAAAWAGRDTVIFAGARSSFTAEGFLLHDVGTIGNGSGKRLNDSLRGLDTPTLKGIWANSAFLHDGSAATVFDVITTANPADAHGRTSHLSAGEKSQLVAYLMQLDENPPDYRVSIRNRSQVPRINPLPRLVLDTRRGAGMPNSVLVLRNRLHEGRSRIFDLTGRNLGVLPLKR